MSSLENARILVVEDEPLIALSLQFELELAGAVVVGPVPSVKDALPLVEAAEFDAAIMNVNLIDGPSYPLAEALQEVGKPFVFVTAFEHSMLPGTFVSVPLLSKPVTTSMLLKRLSEILAASEGASALPRDGRLDTTPQ